MRRPTTVPESVWAAFAKYPKDGFFVLPGIEFEADELIEHGTAEYDCRRAKFGGLMVSSLETLPGLDPQGSGKFRPWWGVRASDSWQQPRIAVQYSAKHMALQTSSYFVGPINCASWIATLEPFADNVRKQFGFAFEDFADLCGALGALVFHETGYELLTVNRESKDFFEFSSALNDADERSGSAPRFLYT